MYRGTRQATNRSANIRRTVPPPFVIFAPNYATFASRLKIQSSPLPKQEWQKSRIGFTIARRPHEKNKLKRLTATHNCRKVCDLPRSKKNLKLKLKVKLKNNNNIRISEVYG